MNLQKYVSEILDDLKENKMEALKKYSKEFDDYEGDILVGEDEFEIINSIPDEDKKIIDETIERIKRYHDHGIAVEGTILLGLDRHDEDFIKRIVDFLLEIDLDLAEFTVLTPFPHTRAWDELNRQKRILSYDWDEYSADKVVYQPKNMDPERLQELLQYAWDSFYQDEPQNIKMYKLLKTVIQKEKADNTYRPRNRDLVGAAFGRPAGQ